MLGAGSSRFKTIVDQELLLVLRSPEVKDVVELGRTLQLRFNQDHPSMLEIEGNRNR
jgi:hypothetical protein